MNEIDKKLLEQKLTLRELLGYCSAKILIGENELYFLEYQSELRKLLVKTDDDRYFVENLRSRK